MAATLVSVDEYLRTSYKPACEYRDGVLTQKSWPARKHSLVQSQVLKLVDSFAGFVACPELTMRLRAGRYLVPDVAVLSRDRIQDPYPTEPVHLCVDILSPDERLSQVIAKAEECHNWGVPMVWILNPEEQTALEFSPNRLHEVPLDGSLTASPISIPVREIFAVLAL